MMSRDGAPRAKEIVDAVTAIAPQCIEASTTANADQTAGVRNLGWCLGSPRRNGPLGSPQYPLPDRLRATLSAPRPWVQALPSAAEDLDRDVGDLGRRAAHPYAPGLERLGLRGRGPLRAGDDRARVAHGLPGRRGGACDVPDHGLGDMLADVLGGLLLGRAADLAAHDDQLGLVVGLEELDDVDERAARHRVATDPDDRRVAEAALRQLVADLVGQRARARDHADVALLEEGRRDDPDIRLARGQDARAVGTDQANGRPLGAQEVVDAQLVVGGDALGDADHRLDAGVGGLEDRVGRERRRHEDHRRVRVGLGDGVVEGVEDRDALDVLAALAGRHAGDHFGAVALVVERVERALATGDAGDAELRVAADDDAHRASSTTFSAASFIVDAGTTLGRFAAGPIRRPAASFVPSSRTTKGTCGSSWRNASTRPLATSSQRVIPPKMLNSTALTLGSERMTSTALVIASAFEPPPASRKFAGLPPYWATTSSVLITSPAPLPRIPTSPSSLT